LRATEAGHSVERGVTPAALVLVSATCVLLAASASVRAADPDRPVCGDDSHPHVAVGSATHRLSLCDAGAVVASFSVRLARKGIGKTIAGDGKLPFGTYALGGPRPSKQFGIFIPIGYPTPEQAAQSYTGGSIGVHGPGRGVRWLGHLVNLFDTTDGCVGIATDDEMKRIAEWVVSHRARNIHIR
jgi:hypothetical protein